MLKVDFVLLYLSKKMMFCHKKTYVLFRILIVALVIPLCRLTSAPSSPVP